MTHPSKILTGAALLAVLLAAGCTTSKLHLDPEFGLAVRQDLAAQVADPEPHYKGQPTAGSNGPRVGLGMTRYEKGIVIQPASAATSGMPAQGGGAGAAGGG